MIIRDMLKFAKYNGKVFLNLSLLYIFLVCFYLPIIEFLPNVAQ
jgi:hypothetical protein